MSTNISKQKREDLLAKVKAIRTYIATAPQDENTANLLAYLAELEQDIGTKKYGLVYEEHHEEIDEILSTHTPVLTEDASLFIEGGGQMNFLIEGDNLASLQLLEKTHRGKIDLIYIDPPYNTGNRDFIYDDVFVDLADTFRHSKWLSFIEKRLVIAKKLLSPKGGIFISIDEHEFAQLKILCDSIFGESNFVECICWDKKSSAKGVPPRTMMANVHEYILVYSTSGIFSFLGEKRDISSFSNPDNDPRGLWRNTNIKSTVKSKSESYTIVDPATGNAFTDAWAYSETELNRLIAEGYIIFPKKSTGQVRKKEFLNELRNDKKAIKSSWGLFDNQKNTEMLKALLPDVFFLNPKPINLLQYLLEVTTLSTSNSTILDFFAGSGTTGHALMKLNAEDGGNRRFILCTNNENNICREVTYERIKRVIERDHYAASLKYYKVDYIPISERFYYEYANELLQHIRELVELENAINFTGNTEIGIVINEDELTAFVQDEEKISKCKKIYVGHDVLFTEEQQAIIEQKGIVISIIPDYYYRDLQEG